MLITGREANSNPFSLRGLFLHRACTGLKLVVIMRECVSSLDIRIKSHAVFYRYLPGRGSFPGAFDIFPAASDAAKLDFS